MLLLSVSFQLTILVAGVVGQLQNVGTGLYNFSVNYYSAGGRSIFRGTPPNQSLSINFPSFPLTTRESEGNETWSFRTGTLEYPLNDSLVEDGSSLAITATTMALDLDTATLPARGDTNQTFCLTLLYHFNSTTSQASVEDDGSCTQTLGADCLAEIQQAFVNSSTALAPTDCLAIPDLGQLASCTAFNLGSPHATWTTNMIRNPSIAVRNVTQLVGNQYNTFLGAKFGFPYQSGETAMYMTSTSHELGNMTQYQSSVNGRWVAFLTSGANSDAREANLTIPNRAQPLCLSIGHTRNGSNASSSTNGTTTGGAGESGAAHTRITATMLIVAVSCALLLM